MRMLFLDIETAPNLGYIWGKWQQNVISYERERYMMCYSYKWLGDEETSVVSQLDFPVAFEKDKHDDRLLCQSMWPLLDEADIIVGHNVKNFDLKSINAFFLVNNIPPPSPYKIIDTLAVARRHFKFNSNSLKDLCKALGLDAKRDAGGFETWLGCMRGDADSWAHMIEYARRDTELLEPLYLRLRPFMSGHPTMTMNEVGAQQLCPKCNSDQIVKNGFRYTKVSKFQVWKCKSCESFSSSRLAMSVADDRPVIVPL